jgi:CubicO group peptidase (beta-lactamase class C family)
MVAESSLITSDLDAHIHGQMARWTVPGVVVGMLRDGERETHAYGVASLETNYPVRPDTLFPIGSIAKVYTAALVMTLVDEGKLDLDTPVATYLPDLGLADERARDTITLRQLLSHQSGIFGDYYDDFGMGDDSLARCVASYSSLRQLSTPGELWAYCSSGFMLAGRVVEVVTGKPFETAMRERVFEPLGLDHSFFFAHEAIVYPTAVGHTLESPGGEHKVSRTYLLPRNVAPAGGVISDAGDLLTFAEFFIGDGAWNGRRILSSGALEAMLTPQVGAANFAAAGYAEWGGLGWAIRFIDGVKIVEHGGSLNGFQVKLKFVPSHNFAIAILTNSGRGCVLGDRVADWALDHFLDLRAPKPATVSLTDDILSRFAGRYRGQDGEEVIFTIENGGLRCVIKETDPTSDHEQAFPSNLLLPISEREFVVVTHDENEGAQVDFIMRDDGALRFMRMDGRLYDPVADEIGA